MPEVFADHKGLCGDAGISTPESAALACAFRSRATVRRRRESVPLFHPRDWAYAFNKLPLKLVSGFLVAA